MKQKLKNYPHEVNFDINDLSNYSKTKLSVKQTDELSLYKSNQLMSGLFGFYFCFRGGKDE